MNVFIHDGEDVRLPPRTVITGKTTDEKILEGTGRYYAHPDYIRKCELPGPDGGVDAYLSTQTSPTAPEPPAPKPVRQTHAQLPREPKPPTEIVTFERFCAHLKFSPAQREQFIQHCVRIHMPANRLAVLCQARGCLTAAQALHYSSAQPSFAPAKAA